MNHYNIPDALFSHKTLFFLRIKETDDLHHHVKLFFLSAILKQTASNTINVTCDTVNT